MIALELSKLDHLQTGVNYIMRVLPKCNASQEGNQAVERVQLWKSSAARQRKSSP